MIHLNDQYIGKKIGSLQTGKKIAEITGMIIDPRDLSIPALYIQERPISKVVKILHTADIRDSTGNIVVIDSYDDLMELTDLPKLQEVINFGFELPGILVINESKKKLGRVDSFGVIEPGWMVGKLNINKNFLKDFSTANMLIDRSQIVSIDNDKIVVKDASNKNYKKVTIATAKQNL